MTLNTVSPALSQTAAASKLLTAAWHISFKHAISQVLANDDSPEVLIAADDAVTAVSAYTGKLLWRFTDLRGPLTRTADRVYALTEHYAVVALEANTGRRLWQSQSVARNKVFDSSLIAIASDKNAVVVCVDPANPVFIAGVFEHTTALRSYDGHVQWRQKEDAGRGRKLVLLPHLLVSTFLALNEPTFSQVDILDRSFGTNRQKIINARYAGIAENTIWLAAWQTEEQFRPVDFKRFSGDSGQFIGEDRYAPATTEDVSVPNGSVSTYSSGFSIPVALGRTAVFLQIGNTLFQYDRAISPSTQTPTTYRMTGTLIGLVDEMPLAVEEGSTDTKFDFLRTKATASDNRKIGGDTSVARYRSILHSKNRWLGEPTILAGSRELAVIRISAILIAVTTSGSLASTTVKGCRAPLGAHVLSDSDLIVWCDTAVVRYTRATE